LRQKFTLKERDNETGLDYFGARHYGSTQGRFISADPFMGSGKSAIPQSWNRYTYCLNNPLLFVDPNGLIWGTWNDDNGTRYFEWYIDKDAMNGSGHKGIEEYRKD
jgi:RHS repeat-associated protein